MRDFSGYVNPEWERKHEQSKRDVEGLSERPLLCPHCGYVNGSIFDDLHFGHMSVDCRKCKNRIKVDMATFKKDADFKKKATGEA